MNSIITIGITGGIGSGKSYICRILEATGYPVFYSDSAAKEILESDNELVSEVQSLFGEEAYLQNNQLNRPFLAGKIFADSSLREKLNQLVHPKVRTAFKVFTAAQNSPFVFNEAAIIFETGGHQFLDKTILVTAPEQIKIERVFKRDGISEDAVKKRMSTQWTDEIKSKLADYIIINDGKLELLPQIMKILDDLKS